MASHHNFPPPIRLEGAQTDILIILPYPSRLEPPIDFATTPTTEANGMASTSNANVGGLGGKLNMSMTMAPEEDVGKCKHIKDSNEYASSSLIWEEWWGTSFLVEEEVPPP